MQARVLSLSDSSQDAAVNAAVKAVLEGRLVVIPTETVYGLAGKDTPECVELIYAAKSRDRGKPIPLLASDPAGLTDLGFRLTSLEERLAEAFWPGPLTMVLDRNGIAEGVRVPDHKLALSIISASGGVLRVTSANQSGEPPALDAAMAAKALSEAAALILDDGPVSGGVPSTVIKCHNEGFDILREGAISHASILEIIEA